MLNNFKKSKLIKIKSKNFFKGSLAFIDDFNIKFKIKRIYYIYDNKIQTRGGHANSKSINFYICLNGKCTIQLLYKKNKKQFTLSKKDQGLIVYPGIFKIVKNLSKDTVLISLCSTNYSEKDFIFKS